MEEIVKFLALIAGSTAVIVPAATAIVNQSRLIRAGGDHFVLRVGSEKFVFDVSSFEDSDLRTIDTATRAVEGEAFNHA